MYHNYIKGLDGLRGLAAVAVFATHYDQIIFIDQTLGIFDLGQLFENGKFAVSLFFTLSGFLLSQPYWEYLLYSAPKPDTKTFLIHRLLRIIPAYYLCLTALLFVQNGWHINFKNPDIWLHYLFLFNFTEFSIFSINSVFWTVAVEMQFYFLLPLLFIVLRRFINHAGLIMLFIILIAYGIHYFLTHTINQHIMWPWDNHLTWVRVHGAVISHSILAHLPHFVMGIFAAWFIKKQQNKAGYKRLTYELVFTLACLLLFIILSTPVYDDITIPSGRYGFPVASMLITLIIISTPQSLVAVTILDSVLLRKLGQISYGVYLYHLPVLNYLDSTLQNAGYDIVKYPFLFAISSFILTLIIASVSYRFFERPILNKIRQKQA